MSVIDCDCGDVPSMRHLDDDGHLPGCPASTTPFGPGFATTIMWCGHCPFAELNDGHCNAADRGLESAYRPPPRWCPLRLAPITIILSATADE